MVKKNAEKDAGFVQQFNELKKKHPDAVLLFRKGDFYEMYKEDALKGIGDTGAEGIRQDSAAGK